MFRVPGRCYISKIHLYNRPTADFVLGTTTRAAPVLCKFLSLVSSWTSLRYPCVFIISAHRKLERAACGPAVRLDARDILGHSRIVGVRSRDRTGTEEVQLPRETLSRATYVFWFPVWRSQRG